INGTFNYYGNLYLSKNNSAMFTPTVVFTGANSTNDQGKNYKNTGINGLAYNPADNSIIATQQWGGANSDGYINKFTANGLNTITANDVYDFSPAKNMISVYMESKFDDGTIWAICLPSGYWEHETPNFIAGNGKLSFSCHPADTSVVMGNNNFPNSVPSRESATYTFNVLNTGSLGQKVSIGVSGAYAYINFNYDTGKKSVSYSHGISYGTQTIEINQ
ncbi:MAG: hypothetical protein RL017_289, partial [Pseudomonadota bacterium]